MCISERGGGGGQSETEHRVEWLTSRGSDGLPRGRTDLQPLKHSVYPPLVSLMVPLRVFAEKWQVFKTSFKLFSLRWAQTCGFPAFNT